MATDGQFKIHIDGVEQIGAHNEHDKAAYRGTQLAQERANATNKPVKMEIFYPFRDHLIFNPLPLIQDSEPPTTTPDPPTPDPIPGPIPPPSQYRGIPDPSVVLGFDVFADYPVQETLRGDLGEYVIQGVGTAANPYFVDISEAFFTRLSIVGSYIILVGGTVNAPAHPKWSFSSSQCDHWVTRDLELIGSGTDQRHGTATGLGNGGVWIRGKIHDFGDRDPQARENDFHGIKTRGTDIWVLDAEIYHMGGDSVQVGDATRGAGSNIYIGGGFFHDNKENAVDIKDSANIVVSGVRMDGFKEGVASRGEAIVVHDDAYDARIYDNIITNSRKGIVSSGYQGHIIDNNSIDATQYDIELRNTRNIKVLNNTNPNGPLKINRQSGVTGEIQ